MSNKVFIGIITFFIVGMAGLAIFQKKDAPPEKPRLGFDQADEGRKHLEEGQGQYSQYKAKIPASGPHTTQTAPWQVYDQQVPDQSVIHNMEHGGVVISYRPDLDSATVAKLKGLFGKPYAKKEFTPSKAIVMPREGQEKPIIIASWNHLIELDSYDEQTLIDQYYKNIGKSPEPNAG